MEWYEISQVKDRIAAIEQYFVELAANESDIYFYGFRFALSLPGAETALLATRSFNEDVASLRRSMLRADKLFLQELDELNTQGKLADQVAVVSLKLRIAQASKPKTQSLSSAFLRGFYRAPKDGKGLFGEDSSVSLQSTIIQLDRLRAIAARFTELLQNRAASDNEIFKPSNVLPDHVAELIDTAISQLETSTSVAPEELKRLRTYLVEAKKEALASSPSWSKIVGALVIVAAVTSGLADAPGAAKTVKDVIEYILGTSVSKPLHKFLPPASDQSIPDVPAKVA